MDTKIAFLILSSILISPSLASAVGRQGQTATQELRASSSMALAETHHHHHHHHHRRHPVADANGNLAAGIVRSFKTGAVARVAARYAAIFQAEVNDLEENYGALIRFMGGIRSGHCSPGSQHPCGKALDLCQTGRGRVDPSCHLPSRTVLAQVAQRHGLFEGGRWCDQDYGHEQISVSAPDCQHRGLRAYAMAEPTRRRHHHRYRVAFASPPPYVQRAFTAH